MVDIRKFVTLSLLASIGLVAAPALAHTIPTELTAETEESAYIQPTCWKCIKNAESHSDTTATLELTYLDEEYGDFDGVIELTVVLADGSENLMYIDDVSLTRGEEAGWILEAPVEWGWISVDTIVLQFLPNE